MFKYTTFRNESHVYPYNDTAYPETLSWLLFPEFFRNDVNFEQFYYDVLPRQVIETCDIPKCLPCPGECEKLPTIWCKDYEVPVRPCIHDYMVDIRDEFWIP